MSERDNNMKNIYMRARKYTMSKCTRDETESKRTWICTSYDIEWMSERDLIERRVAIGVIYVQYAYEYLVVLAHATYICEFHITFVSFLFASLFLFHIFFIFRSFVSCSIFWLFILDSLKSIPLRLSFLHSNSFSVSLSELPKYGVNKCEH